ncbi:hypothetical protein EON68_02685 [archaeon]|nr:MAG: hypothetical protein EON68_02685 [archaeon]
MTPCPGVAPQRCACSVIDSEIREIRAATVGKSSLPPVSRRPRLPLEYQTLLKFIPALGSNVEFVSSPTPLPAVLWPSDSPTLSVKTGAAGALRRTLRACCPPLMRAHAHTRTPVHAHHECCTRARTHTLCRWKRHVSKPSSFRLTHRRGIATGA